MRQINLMVLCQDLKPGQCINVPDHEMREAATGSISSPLFNGPARADDVRRFVDQIKQNWGVQVSQRVTDDEWVICRSEADSNPRK